MEDSKADHAPQRGEKYIVRFPSVGMRDRIAEAAKKNGRSMNSEILERLSLTFRWDELAHPAPGDLMDEIKVTMGRLESLIKEFQMQKVVASPAAEDGKDA